MPNEQQHDPDVDVDEDAKYPEPADGEAEDVPDEATDDYDAVAEADETAHGDLFGHGATEDPA